jgi:uncharacterized protein YdcH (DUF465 family)
MDGAEDDFTVENLDAEPISADLDSHIDSMLDAAEAANSGTSGDNTSEGGLAEQAQKLAESQQPTPPQQQQQTPDDDIAAIAEPEGMSEKNRSNWQRLREAAATYKKQAAEAEQLRQRIAELEKGQPQTTAPEDYEELKKFKATFDIQNDPSFRQKFSDQIDKASQGIYGLLKKWKASDETITAIQNVGGPSKVPLSWWKTNVIDKLAASEETYLDARKIENALAQLDDIEAEMQSEIENAKQNADGWYKNKMEEFQQNFNKNHEEAWKHVDELTKDIPAFRYKEVPQNASQEELAKINSHNEYVKDLEGKYMSALYPKTVKDAATVAAAATLSHILTHQLEVEQKEKASLLAELNQLRGRMGAVSGAGRMPKSNASTVVAQPQVSSASRISMNSLDAIEAGLSEAER